MGEPESPQHLPPPLPAQPIPYATPLPPGKTGVPVGGRWAIGCSGYIVLSVLWFFVAAFLNGMGLPPWSGLVGWVVMTVGLLGIALFLRIRYGYKGYGYGILSVLGAAALLILGCFLLIAMICGSGRGAGHSGI
jgi:hypothetical protein